MNDRPVVVDTNVVVAGLISADERLPVAMVLDGVLAAEFPFALSEALLAEYRVVLARPAIRKLHGLSDDEIEVVLTDIAQHAIVLTPVRACPAPDAGDQLLWDLMAAHDHLLLVTGDKALLTDPGMRDRVLSPRAFIASRSGKAAMEKRGRYVREAVADLRKAREGVSLGRLKGVELIREGRR